jgi:hypothetical protein
LPDPLQWRILLHGCPLSKTKEEAMHQIAEIQFLQACPNPRYCRILRRYGQLTISKAFEISSLMNKVGVFLFYRLFITSWT